MTVIKIIRISLAMCPQTKNESATETKSHRRTRYDKGENDEQIKLKLCAYRSFAIPQSFICTVNIPYVNDNVNCFYTYFQKIFQKFFFGAKNALAASPAPLPAKARRARIFCQNRAPRKEMSSRRGCYLPDLRRRSRADLFLRTSSSRLDGASSGRAGETEQRDSDNSSFSYSPTCSSSTAE